MSVAADVRRHPVAADPIRLCRSLGIDKPSKRYRSGLLVRCPAHTEQTPSCSVSVGADGTVRWRCHACSETGDAVTLVQVVCGLRFGDALEHLADLCGGNVPAMVRAGSERSKEDKKASFQEHSPGGSHIPSVPVAPVVEALLELCPVGSQPDVRAYLERRGIFVDAEANGFGALPPLEGQWNVIASLRSAVSGHDVAWLTEGSRLSHPEHRLLMPWRNVAGEVVALQRRRIEGDGVRYVWPRGSLSRIPYGVDTIAAARAFHGGDCPIVVTEGVLDALARRALARMHDERVVVVGVASASTMPMGLEETFGGQDVRIAFDADEAGDRAAETFAEALVGISRRVTRERPPNGMDVNDMLMEMR